LPPTEGVTAVATAQIEKRALDTKAGAAVRALLADSGAQHLQRVVGWPIGAVAIDDTVYVNASWLVALAPADEKVDGGADVKASSVGSQAGASVPKRPIVGTPLGIESAEEEDTPATSDSTPILRETFTMTNRPDAGPTTSATTSSSQSDNVALDDACSACADSCATSNNDSCDTSDESSDSCDTSDESTDNSCNSSADDSSQACNSTTDTSSQACSSTDEGAATCQVAHGGRRKNSGTLPWLLAPLGFLLFRKRS
jgi:hypothetical protein